MANITFVDENDTVVGAGTKQDAWQKGHIHRIVRIFIFNSNKEALMQKRADHLQSMPGKWTQAASGHVDEGEDYATAAARELAEEIGIEGIELREYGKFFSDERDETGKIKKRFDMTYTGIYDGEVKPNPEEVSEIRWLPLNELEAWVRERPAEFTPGFVKSFRQLQNLTS